jgi:carbon storage regulator
MLVLSRKEGESVMIGTDVKVMILSVRKGIIRLGISAPRNVVIDREEVMIRKLAEREAV